MTPSGSTGEGHHRLGVLRLLPLWVLGLLIAFYLLGRQLGYELDLGLWWW